MSEETRAETARLFRNFCVQAGWIAPHVPNSFEARVADLLRSTEEKARPAAESKLAKAVEELRIDSDLFAKIAALAIANIADAAIVKQADYDGRLSLAAVQKLVEHKKSAEERAAKAEAALKQERAKVLERAIKVVSKHIARVRKECQPGEFCRDFAYEADMIRAELKALAAAPEDEEKDHRTDECRHPLRGPKGQLVYCGQCMNDQQRGRIASMPEPPEEGAREDG